MSNAQWYQLLVEQEITMMEPEDSPRKFIECRVERMSPTTSWETSWRRVRLRGLGSGATSFLWKLMHQLLPTENRLSRILPNSEANCKLCADSAVADLIHCFFQCVTTREMGSWLLSTIAVYDSTVTPTKLLRLEFEVEASMEMPLVWISAHTLLYMWGVRCSGKTVNLYLTRAALESKISLLWETRYCNE